MRKRGFLSVSSQIKATFIHIVTREKQIINIPDNYEELIDVISELFKIKASEFEILNQSDEKMKFVDDFCNDATYIVSVGKKKFISPPGKKLFDPSNRVSFDPFEEINAPIEYQDAKVTTKRKEKLKSEKPLVNLFKKNNDMPKRIISDKQSVATKHTSSSKSKQLFSKSSSRVEKVVDDEPDWLSVSTVKGKRLISCLSTAPDPEKFNDSQHSSEEEISNEEASVGQEIITNDDENPLYMAMECVSNPFKQVDGDFPNFELQQLKKWVNGSIMQKFIVTHPYSKQDEITNQRVKEVLKDHRFVINGSVIHRIKMAIVGPKQSGKSYFLCSLARTLALELGASGEWKSHWIFAYDVNDWIKHIVDTKDFLSFVISSTLDSIIEQRPQVKPYATTIKKQLLSILDFEAPSKAKHPYGQIEEIARLLSGIWRNKDAFENWISSMFMIPSLIARAVGFKNMTFFIDNFDSFGFNLESNNPRFSNNAIVNTIEHLKASLIQTNFVISAKNCDTLFNLLQPTDYYGIDISHGISILTTYCYTLEIPEFLKGFRFIVTTKEEPNPIIIDSSVCCGNPKYLLMWDSMIKSWIKFEKSQGSPEKKEEDYVELLTLFQEFFESVFVCISSPTISVLTVDKAK